MTLDMNHSGNVLGPKFLIIILFLALSAGAYYIVCNQHALDRHGAGTLAAVSGCFDNNPKLFTMFNKETKRNADVCFDGGKFHIHVTSEEGNPITTFTKDKMKDAEQVFRYLCNVGYTLAGRDCPVKN